MPGHDGVRNLIIITTALVLALVWIGFATLGQGHQAGGSVPSQDDAPPATAATTSAAGTSEQRATHVGDDALAEPAPRRTAHAEGEPASRVSSPMLLGTCHVTGTVRDTTGQPAAAMEVSFTSPLPAETRLVFADRVTTGADGTFDLSRPLPPGTWSVSVLDRVLVAPRALRVRTTQKSAHVDVVVQKSDVHMTIAGMVVDDDGRPHAEVLILARESGQIVGRAVSGADGRFGLRCMGDATRPAALFWSSPDDRTTGMKVGLVDWGATGVLLTVSRNPSEATGTLELQVVGPDEATPVESFAVRCFPEASRLPAATQLREAGVHAGGRVRMATAATGEQALFVHPAAPDHMPAGPEFFEAEVRGVARRVVLRRRTSLPVRVQLRDGSPVSRANVELLRPWGDLAVARTTYSIPLTDPSASPWTRDIAVRLDVAATDSTGTAWLSAPACEGGLVVRVLGPRCLVRVIDNVVVAASETRPVIAVVELGGTLSARVLGSEALQRFRADHSSAAKATVDFAPESSGPMLALTLCGMPRDPNPAPTTCWPIPGDGRVQIEGIPSGVWEVHLACWTRLGPNEPLRCWSPDQPLLTVRFERSEVKSAELDARRYAPGRVEGRILIDGDAFSHGPVRIAVLAEGGRKEHRAFGWSTDAEGRFTLDPMLPGSVRIQASELDPTSGDWFTGDVGGPLLVLPGATVRGDFVAASRAK